MKRSIFIILAMLFLMLPLFAVIPTYTAQFSGGEIDFYLTTLESALGITINEVHVAEFITDRDALSPAANDVVVVKDAFGDTGLHKKHSYYWSGSAWVSVEKLILDKSNPTINTSLIVSGDLIPENDILLGNLGALKARNNADTDDIALIKLSLDDNIVFGAPIEVGSFIISQEEGVVQLANILTVSDTLGDEHGVTIDVDGVPVLTVYGESGTADERQAIVDGDFVVKNNINVENNVFLDGELTVNKSIIGSSSYFDKIPASEEAIANGQYASGTQVYVDGDVRNLISIGDTLFLDLDDILETDHYITVTNIGYLASGEGATIISFNEIPNFTNTTEFNVIIPSKEEQIIVGSIAFGDSNTVSSDNSATFGSKNIISGTGSFASGESNEVTGKYSNAKGLNNIASGDYSSIEGRSSESSGDYSKAIGYFTKASGDYSFAAGYGSEASASYSFATGRNTDATNQYASAFGLNSLASGESSFAHGEGTVAQGRCQIVFGSYNIAQGTSTTQYGTDYAFIVGNGDSSANRSNALSLSWEGNLAIGGDSMTIETSKTPATSTSPGTTGTVCWDANYIYVCIATDTWKRTAIDTW